MIIMILADLFHTNCRVGKASLYPPVQNIGKCGEMVGFAPLRFAPFHSTHPTKIIYFGVKINFNYSSVMPK